MKITKKYLSYENRNSEEKSTEPQSLVRHQHTNTVIKVISGEKEASPWLGDKPAMQETQETRVRSLGQEDSLEEEMETHYSILAWRMDSEPGGLQSIDSQRGSHG